MRSLRIITSILFILFPYTLSPIPYPLLFSAFKDPGFLARPAGMGGAFVSVADDANAQWYNPAGIVYVSGRTAVFTYSKPFANLSGVDINTSYAAYLYPTEKQGTFGAGWARFSTTGLYSENTYLMSYGRDFSVLTAGLSLKYLNRAIITDERSADDEVFNNGTQKGAFSFDIGLLKSWEDIIDAGLCVKNVTQPDVGFAIQDNVPAEISMGASRSFMPEFVSGEILTAIALSQRDTRFNVHLGSELWLKERKFAARVGANRNEVSMGGSFLYTLTGTDMGIETHYSFTWPLYVEGTIGSHRLTLGFQF